MGAIAEVFAPLIPAIITGGLILGFRNILGDMPYFGPDGNQTLASLSQFWTGVYGFLWLIGEAVFHLGIPVGRAWNRNPQLSPDRRPGLRTLQAV